MQSLARLEQARPPLTTYEEKLQFLSWSEPILQQYGSLLRPIIKGDRDLPTDSCEVSVVASYQNKEVDECDELLKKRYAETTRYNGAKDGRFTASPWDHMGEIYKGSRIIHWAQTIKKEDYDSIKRASYSDGYADAGSLSSRIYDELFDSTNGADGFDSESASDRIRATVRDGEAKDLLGSKLDWLENALRTDETPEKDINALAMQAFLLALLIGKKSTYQNTALKLNSLANRYKSAHKITDDDTSTIYTYGNQPMQEENTRAIQELLKRRPDLASQYVKLSTILIKASTLFALRDKAEEISEITHDYFVNIGRKRLNTDNIDSEVAFRQSLIDYVNNKTGSDISYPGPSKKVLAIELNPTELNWEILPPGKLLDASKAIVDEVNKRDNGKAKIDIERLRILENIREFWGPDRCYYTRGTRKARSVIRDDNGNEQPDEYIVLVLQETNNNGLVVNEHAVAESPITRRNAIYVYRQDVSGEKGGWRSVLSLDKKQARQLGAKSVKHTSPEGHDMAKITTSKIEHLITCSPDEFAATDFAGISRDGEIRIRIGRILTNASSY